MNETNEAPAKEPMTNIPHPKVRVVQTIGEFRIEEGVAAPPRHCGTGRRFKYPFDSLEKGQSIFIAGLKPKDVAGTVTSLNKTRQPDLAGRKYIARAHWAVDALGDPVEPRIEGVRVLRIK